TCALPILGFPVGELLPVPICVLLRAGSHVLSPSGKQLVLVGHVLGKQEVEPRLAGLYVPHSSALELLAYDVPADLAHGVSHLVSPPREDAAVSRGLRVRLAAGQLRCPLASIAR